MNNTEDPLDAAEGCVRGCLITIPFWVILIVILVLLSLSCAAQTVPIQNKPSLASISIKPTQSSTPTESPKTVETIGQVNIRVCPATNCEVLDVAKKGMKLTVVGNVRYTNDTVNCDIWQNVDWKGQTAYVCNRWVR